MLRRGWQREGDTLTELRTGCSHINRYENPLKADEVGGGKKDKDYVLDPSLIYSALSMTAVT